MADLQKPALLHDVRPITMGTMDLTVAISTEYSVHGPPAKFMVAPFRISF